MKQYAMIFTGSTGRIQVEANRAGTYWMSLDEVEDPTGLELYDEGCLGSTVMCVVSGRFSYISLDELMVLKVMSA